MRGFVYNNPQLAHEGDGFWTFNEGKPEPHAYWCVPNSVIETCPMQLSDDVASVTIGIGRCVHRIKSDLTTEPIVFMNPEMVKKAYRPYVQRRITWAWIIRPILALMRNVKRVRLLKSTKLVLALTITASCMA
jgi:hypothetical protein